MQIHGAAHVHGPQPINAPHRAPAAQPTAPKMTVTGGDQLDISPKAEMASRIRELPEIRAERVAELREAIESGTYESPEKLSIALDRLLDEIGG